MERRFTFAATTAGRSFCPRPPVPSRRASLDAAVDKKAANARVLYPFFGWLLSPIIAGAAMSLSSVSVISNAFRLRKVKL
jgi:hypothetical protein